MIFHYGPSGRYFASNTILAPSVIAEINYKDKTLTGQNQIQFVFNRIEFSYFDKLRGELIQVPVDQNVYEKFYQNVQADQSIDQVPTEVEQEFSRGLLATLSLVMHADLNASPQITQVFQVIQFTESNYYRVSLSTMTTQNRQEWAYFYHPHLYEEIMRIFTKV